MHAIHFAWPEGNTGCLTTSWDDGTLDDRRLVEIMNKYGIRGTFNLNSSILGRRKAKGGWADNVDAEELPELYKGHEVAVHTVTHPFLQRLPDAQIVAEILEDRRRLEQIMGYPITGMALPYGTGGRRAREIARRIGMVYCRPVGNLNFELPDDFLDWVPTTHIKANLTELWDNYLKCPYPDRLFYLWGHSYEFDRRNEWEFIEEFFKLAGGTEKIWHATNFQVWEYVTAWRNLDCAIDGSSVRNRSAVTLWFKTQDQLLQLKPGEVRRI